MEKLNYVARAVPSQGGYVVTFPDFTSPDLILIVTEGDTLKEAKENARDALMSGLSYLKSEGKEFPNPEYRLSDAFEEIKQFRVTIELSDLVV